jgi:hypothetical protein
MTLYSDMRALLIEAVSAIEWSDEIYLGKQKIHRREFVKIKRDIRKILRWTRTHNTYTVTDHGASIELLAHYKNEKLSVHVVKYNGEYEICIGDYHWGEYYSGKTCS